MLRDEGALRAEPRPGGSVAAACEGVVKIYWSGTGEVQALKGVDAVFSQNVVRIVTGKTSVAHSAIP